MKAYTEDEAKRLEGRIEVFSDTRMYPRKRAIEIAAQKLDKGWRPIIISHKRPSASGRTITRYLPGQWRTLT